MMPFYNYVGSSNEPHHKNHQLPYTPYPQYATSEPFPSQAITNPLNSQIPYSNYGYPIPYPPPPPPHHHHPYFPIYHQPPYPQIPPPMPIYCCGAHPTYPPPYYYPTELGQFEFDKNASGIPHCCGCPNHVCSKREEDRVNREGVKIEEQEPDDIVERKQRKQRDSDLGGPIRFKNYPFPIMWVPDNNTDAKEQRNFASDQENGALKSLDSEPRNLNGWFPLNMNKLGGFVNGDEKRPITFPIIWMPSNDKEVEAAKKEMIPDASPKSIEELPSKDAGRNILEENRESGGTVKQLEQQKEKGKLEVGEKRRKDVPVKRVEQNVEKEVSPNNEKKKTETKLPPVCLRVDPLPKKRNGKGSSRSPSPPASSKGPASSSLSEQSQQGSKPVEQQSKNEKFIKVVDVQSCENKDDKQKKNPQNESPGALPVNSELKSLKEPSMEESSDKKQIEEKDEAATEPNGVERKKTAKRYLSETEAAVLIQSAYRGFELRKWQPLRKLKQLAEVKEQAIEIRHRIEALDSSPDLRKDEKLSIMIGEMIMRLLLILDTIQGLHPSTRETRKSLARELVTLQERLDSVMKSEDRETEKVKEEEGGGPGNDSDVIESKESQLSSDMVEYMSGLEAKESLDRKEGDKLVEKEAAITDNMSKEVESKEENEAEKGQEEVQAVEETVAELEDLDQGVLVEVQKEEHVEEEAVITDDMSKEGESKEENEAEKGKEEVQSVEETVAELVDLDQGVSVQVQKEEHVEEAAVVTDDISKEGESKEENEEEMVQSVEETVAESEDLDHGVLVQVQQEEEHVDPSEPGLKAKDMVNLDSTAGTLDVFPLDRKNEKEIEIETSVEEIRLASETREDHAVSELENKLEQDGEKNRVVGDNLGIDATAEEENLPSENVLEFEHPDLQQISPAIEKDATHESERETVSIEEKEDKDAIEEEEEEKEPENAKLELSREPEKGAGSLGWAKGGDDATMELCCEKEETEVGKLTDENKKMREMIEKLIEDGKEQLNVISGLTARVKHLEEKKKKNNRFYRKTKLTRRPRRSQPLSSGSS